jgi:UDP-4-amino-4,6-dideoxy-N-acetyl-beta-L-altrosamine transaminase
MIPYGRQDVTQADLEAVAEVLRSDFLTQGPAVGVFERNVAARVGARHAIAVNSATSALHIACVALKLGPGDLLWTVPNTFVASANCARYCGADVDFVDIDPRTWNMSVARLQEKLVRARSAGRLPKVVIPVHFGGQPSEQQAIHALAEEYGFRIVEDASHSIGATRDGEPVGSCRWSDITVFSFHPVKVITSGEGGMALTNDAELAGSLATLRTHGITRDPARWHGPVDARDSTGPWYYEQHQLGFNYRMTDIQAALGNSQLHRLDAYVARRNALVRRYDEGLRGLPLRSQTIEPQNVSAFHLYVVRASSAATGRPYAEVFNALRARDIAVSLHYLPVHLQPYYRALGFTAGQYPEAEAHGREAITLPLYATLSDAQQDQVIVALREILS